MQRSSEQEPFGNVKQAGNILMFILLALAVSLEVFFHRRFGPRYFGFPTFAALLGIPMWTVLWPRESAVPLLIFWALFILMLLRARAESAWLARRGPAVHSRYNGVPRLAAVFKRTPEWKLKGGMEPFLGFFAGVLLLPVSQPLGSYLMCAALAMGLSNGLARSVSHARALDMHDNLIDQQMHMERFHELRDRDRWSRS
jgi:hypothetical protein